MRLEHFLMKKRTKSQIIELFERSGFEAVEKETKNNETYYMLGFVSKMSTSLSPDYWFYLANKKIKSLR